MGTDRPVRLMAVSVGFMLSLSLILLEYSSGVNLVTSLGGISVLIIVLLLAVMAYALIHKTGLGMPGSLAGAFMLAYLAFKTVLPLQWTEYHLLSNWLNLGAFLAFLVFIYQGTSAILGRKYSTDLALLNGYLPSLKAEEELLKLQLEPITRQEVKTIEQKIAEYAFILHSARKIGRGNATTLIQKIRAIVPKKEETRVRIEQVKGVFDELKKACSGFQEGSFQKETDSAVQKIVSLEVEVIKHETTADELAVKACLYYSYNDVRNAEKMLELAIKNEYSALELLERIQEFEAFLQTLLQKIRGEIK